MELKVIKNGKWILDIENNKLWSNSCNTCCIECEFECEQHCNYVFKDGCYDCELDR